MGQQGSPIVQELQPHVQSGQLKLRYLPELCVIIDGFML